MVEEVWVQSKKSEMDAWRLHQNPSVIDYIVIHHSLSSDGVEKNWESIRKFHTSWRYKDNAIAEDYAKKLQIEGKPVTPPWSDIGYHFGVENIGGEYTVMLGRPLDKRGAHVGDGHFNIKSIGICVVGNFDKQAPPEKQWWLAVLLVNRLREHYASKNNSIQIEHVLGHREAQAIAGVAPINRKTCPGNLFDMAKFRSNLS